jgi:hypothetical protein
MAPEEAATVPPASCSLGGVVRVELLWWEGCPSTPQARAELLAAMREAGLGPAALREVEIDTEAAADAHGFVGSPTVRVDGRDVQPPAVDEPAGLSCRVYRRRDGRISPTPDPADLRDALAGAVAP